MQRKGTATWVNIPGDGLNKYFLNTFCMRSESNFALMEIYKSNMEFGLNSPEFP